MGISALAAQQRHWALLSQAHFATPLAVAILRRHVGVLTLCQSTTPSEQGQSHLLVATQPTTWAVIRTRNQHSFLRMLRLVRVIMPGSVEGFAVRSAGRYTARKPVVSAVVATVRLTR